jgi:hypothetical protein
VTYCKVTGPGVRLERQLKSMKEVEIEGVMGGTQSGHLPNISYKLPLDPNCSVNFIQYFRCIYT